ncbi:protein-tyrosine phosphatase family protein [Metasolibacillus fluoroglycofenilyticus]|uniref:protein-tyrosine phosphatase family protein n=1 Tax=Metasolibacillus fluoroglycofenilyticus TaxID=1239396 RepID=UPI000D344CED|nr:dual specificity protein phosphatase family protein [Metasolibacillus fluoroglycofenilyticus]
MGYDELVKGRIYLGGAADAQEVVDNENIDIVYDVRVNSVQDAEVPACPIVHAAIVEQHLADSIEAGATSIKEAYESGKNIFIHCGSGNGRASVMATAALLELGLANDLESAEQMVKEVRQSANIRPNMREALEKLYK